MKRVRRVVELLAEGWPRDYRDEAVEWPVVQSRNSSAGNAAGEARRS